MWTRSLPGSGLLPYIHNGELSSKAVKRRQWAEGVRPSEHVSDTCWFVKKPGSGEENPRVLFCDADQESKMRMRYNALQTGPRHAVE
ncbi:hypothetical protein TNCV_1010731 [Trichonephila clavipes]|nr:hypothetical protein TNCV_1010731 [Trichonephila clavipes]